MASQRLGAQGAPASGVQAPDETGIVSGLMEGAPPRMTRSWGQETVDHAQSKGGAQRPTAEADQAAAHDLDLWISRISDVEQLTVQVRTRWILMDVTHIRTSARTMADVTFNLREGRHSPPPTMEYPGQRRFVATCLMAHMGVYTPDDINRLNWRWHHRAALHIREALIRHKVKASRTSVPKGPPTPDRTKGHQRQRSPTAQGPPRQVAHTGHSQSPHR